MLELTELCAAVQNQRVAFTSALPLLVVSMQQHDNTPIACKQTACIAVFALVASTVHSHTADTANRWQRPLPPFLNPTPPAQAA
jgi:hypothetical protein